MGRVIELMKGIQVLKAAKFEMPLKVINQSGDTLFEGLHPRARVENSYGKEILEADVYVVSADGGTLVIEVRLEKG